MQMDRRLVVGILLLALVWQGPVLAYSASLAVPMSTISGGTHCGGAHLSSGTACDKCCNSHGSAFCSPACILSLGVALPTALPPVVVTVPRVSTPDAERLPFAERHPALLLRPPIV